DMDPIVDLCKKRGIALIEDSAQAYDTTYKSRHVGTFGKAGCFSLQEGKNMTSGEGGMLVSLADHPSRRIQLLTPDPWWYGDRHRSFTPPPTPREPRRGSPRWWCCRGTRSTCGITLRTLVRRSGARPASSRRARHETRRQANEDRSGRGRPHRDQPSRSHRSC